MDQLDLAALGPGTHGHVGDLHLVGQRPHAGEDHVEVHLGRLAVGDLDHGWQPSGSERSGDRIGVGRRGLEHLPLLLTPPPGAARNGGRAESSYQDQGHEPDSASLRAPSVPSARGR
ncbi:hypothetical protein [Jannaschia sp. R86511]|uniref:hypothetical protein n=1 Tax=Jannaschia sp. R86511 TaxID=3093853 RepID=UPI0036D37F25